MALVKADGALVRVKFSWMLDHWVAVLEVTDERVVVGDPYTGRREYTHADFLGKWRHSGLQLWRVE